MNSRVIKLLLRLCVLLLIILLVEWLIIIFPETSAVKSLSAVEEDQRQDTQLPELVLTEQSIETYLDMVDRPLFIEGRRPVVDLKEGNDIQELSKIDDFILVGIYSKDGRLIALFSQQGSDKKYSKKSEGDDISGWLLTEIQADQIILEQAGEQQTIMLRKPKPKTSPKITTKSKPKLVTPKRKPIAPKRKTIAPKPKKI